MLDETNRLVHVDTGDAVVEGTLARPQKARGVVCIAHGSGSSRHSTRNRTVAQDLYEHDLAVLLIDLLTPEEKAKQQEGTPVRLNLAALVGRVSGSVAWLSDHEPTQGLPVGTYGSSLGAAGALYAAAMHPDLVGAVVSRGGRPDLVEPIFDLVSAPVLLLAGERDTPILEANREVARQLSAPVHLEVIDDATHLFEEPGALDAVIDHTRAWYEQHLIG